MSHDLVIGLLRQMLELAVVLSTPVILAAIAAGTLMAVLQAATQIQESALVFAPKLLAVVVVLAAASPWALDQLVGFTAAVLEDVAQVGNER